MLNGESCLERYKRLVEVTPEMIEAGYRVLCSSGIVDECLEADRLVVEEIYRAMFALRRQRP